MSDNIKQAMIPKSNVRKVGLAEHPNTGVPAGKPLAPNSAPVSMKNELARLRTAAEAVQQIRISAQRELAIAKKMRAEALRYQQESETKARSQAQQLILHARLTTQKEIEELISKASAEIQKILADIRAIRITAQEELATQHKYTDAARLLSLSFRIQDDTEPEGKRKKQLVFRQ